MNVLSTFKIALFNKKNNPQEYLRSITCLNMLPYFFMGNLPFKVRQQLMFHEFKFISSGINTLDVEKRIG